MGQLSWQAWDIPGLLLLFRTSTSQSTFSSAFFFSFLLLCRRLGDTHVQYLEIQQSWWIFFITDLRRLDFFYYVFLIMEDFEYFLEGMYHDVTF
jgi:hypothetical protein